MVDEERVTRLTSEVFGDVARLRRLATTDDLMNRPDQLDSVKYRFVTAIEGCVSIAHHILASQGWEAPDTNADAMRGLGKHGVITEDLATAMAKASGFRNLLVHQYGEIDDEAVVSFLGNIEQLQDYVSQVLTWLSTETTHEVGDDNQSTSGGA